MNHLEQLRELGTSCWLDDLSRERLNTGNLEEVIRTKAVVGVTTNPAIFAAAMTTGTAYDEQLAQLRAEGAKAERAVYAMAIEDVRRACDVLADIYHASGGKDGRVSIEVDPRIANDRDATVAQARQLWERVDRPNVMIKIPATPESLLAVSDVTAEGICVNVTLIFSVSRYREVVAAYLDGLARAAEQGVDISKIHSVASFFVSRLDTEVDRRLEEIGTPAALALRGKAGVANAQLAYQAFKELFDDAPGNVQRPLWASTGVKNPEYPATMYVTELAGPDTVNTMPEATIDALLEQGGLHGDTLTGAGEQAQQVLKDLDTVGVDLADVFAVLEREGVEKFVASWTELLDSMNNRLAG
ncbi:transaldolase [Corynebacterium canis]|uniref:Transaldolase n=1 Tax=Corynebacterium canis TaxID=679663 RepID=A0A5C5UU56_9CORY|nr:transaldolase [Corynebacterium canis]TWT29102.1 transaldolase [Corynebacterium canis]WJY75335.1 Transaldolase [Corynebacterium canis]